VANKCWHQNSPTAPNMVEIKQNKVHCKKTIQNYYGDWVLIENLSKVKRKGPKAIGLPVDMLLV